MAKSFTSGQEVTMYVNGAGVTSTEEHIVDSVEDGVVTLVESEKTFDLLGKCLETDNFFGFSFSIE